MTGPVTCHACGEQWPRHPALEVPCPTCQADVGKACHKPSGHARWDYEGPHVPREQRAVDEGFMSICTASRGAEPTDSSAREPAAPGPLFESAR